MDPGADVDAVELLARIVYNLDPDELVEFKSGLDELLDGPARAILDRSADLQHRARAMGIVEPFLRSWTVSFEVSRNAQWRKHIDEAGEAWSADPTPNGLDELLQAIAAR